MNQTADVLGGGAVHLSDLDPETPLPSHPIARSDGIGIFLSPSSKRTPTVFHSVATRFRTLPTTIVFLTVEKENVPSITENKVVVKNYGSDIYRIIVKRGYSENKLDIMDMLNIAVEQGFPQYDPRMVTFYLNKVHPTIGGRNQIVRAVYSYYSFFKQLYSGRVNNVHIPANLSVEIGILVPLC